MLSPSTMKNGSLRSSRLSHFSPRSSSLTLLEDCQICLDPMKQTDFDHPLQCEIHCGFNMCKSCIESLLESSKDDYMEASDGSRQVKVWLHCPNCRSDLSHSIRDTLLLRKADEVAYCAKRQKDRSEWTNSQLRLEKALGTPEVKQAIFQARKIEDEYLGRAADDFVEEEVDDESFVFDQKEEGSESESDNLSGSFSMEEWGVEADLHVGVHASFRMPPPPNPVVREEAIQVDPTLLAGLDYFLNDDQRKEITLLMTSGDPAKLSEAAGILHAVAREIGSPRQRQQNNLTPAPTPQPQQSQQQHQKKSSSSSSNSQKPNLGKRMSTIGSSRRKSLARRSSVFDLIADANKAHVRKDAGANNYGRAYKGSEEKKVAETMHALATINGKSKDTKASRSRVAQHRAVEREIQLQADFQKRFPVPVRMPKAIEVDLAFPLDMEFLDYKWAGTVMDAYSKISIGFRNRVTQRRPNNSNVGVILGHGSDDIGASSATSTALGCALGLCGVDETDVNDVYIALPGEARVLVSHAGRSGRQGAIRGDVVTHIEGESVAGKSASQVMDILRYKQCQVRDSEGTTVVLTLNAEKSVAEALKRRALAIARI